MKKAVVVVCVLFESAVTAEAACTIRAQSEKTRGGWYRVFWEPVAGASDYHVEILRVKNAYERTHVSDVDTTGATVDVRFQVASDTTLTYRVTAINDSDASFEPCSASIDVTVPANAAFRKLTRRLILPVAGSTAGANGASFHTSLKLTATFSDQRGRIIFRRAGLLPSDADPSLVWDFTHGEVSEVKYDDVVAAMGQRGIGYLEIVPDDDASAYMPRVEARIYNESADGTFGTLEEAVEPADFTDHVSFSVSTPDPRFRLNIGYVALGQAGLIVSVSDSHGKSKASKTIDALDGSFRLASVQELTGIDPAAGDVVRVFTVPNGALIPFYTLTENATNDPELIVPARALTIDVGAAIK